MRHNGRGGLNLTLCCALQPDRAKQCIGLLSSWAANLPEIVSVLSQRHLLKVDRGESQIFQRTHVIPARLLRASRQPRMALTTYLLLPCHRQRIFKFDLFLFSGSLRGVALVCEENCVPWPFAELWRTHRRLDRKQRSQQNTKAGILQILFLLPHDTARNYNEAQHSQKLVWFPFKW